MNKISAVYKITNTITGDCYIGSSNDVKKRWRDHKCPSTWKRFPNNQLYQDMQKYGLDKFDFQVIAEVEIDSLKEMEQQFIETLKPTYNDRNAKGCDTERYKEYMKEYMKTDRYKESKKEYDKEYRKTDKRKEYMKEYMKTDRYKEYQKEYNKEYHKSDRYKKYMKEYKSQLCCYDGKTITLGALSNRFRRMGIDHPTQEAKKYLI